jgi:hypothetical protein
MRSRTPHFERSEVLLDLLGATATCAAPTLGGFGSSSCATLAALSASPLFLASSASASTLAAARVLCFDARGAEAPSSVFAALIGIGQGLARSLGATRLRRSTRTASLC